MANRTEQPAPRREKWTMDPETKRYLRTGGMILLWILFFPIVVIWQLMKLQK